MNAPTSARRAATRARLLAAAIPVIAQKGVLGCSVEEVCEAAGFTRGAFYSNFENKDELCLAVLAAQGERYLEAARRAIEGLDPHRPVAEQITGATATFISTAAGDPNAVLVMSELRLHAAREPSIREAFQRVDAEAMPLFAEVIEQGVRASGQRLRIPIDEALSLLHAVYDQTALDQLVRGQAPDSPDAARRLTMVLQGLLVSEETETRTGDVPGTTSATTG